MTYQTQLPRPHEVALREYATYADALKARLEDGNYAVQRGDSGAIDFIRVSRPYGRFTIQSRHSDELELRIQDKYRNRFGSEYIFIHSARWVQIAVEAMADPLRASLLFAEKLDRCCSCYKSLTDRRSRFYGIGPECETKRPLLFEMIVMTKGFYEFSENAQETGVEFDLGL